MRLLHFAISCELVSRTKEWSLFIEYFHFYLGLLCLFSVQA